MPIRVPEEELQKAVDAYAKHNHSIKEAAEFLGLPPSTLKNRIRMADGKGILPKMIPSTTKPNGPNEAIRSDKSDDVWTVQWTDLSIDTDTMLDKLGVDRTVWAIERETLNGWDMTGRIRTEQVGSSGDGTEWVSEFGKFLNCQRKVILKRIIPESTEKAIAEIASRTPSPKWPKIKYNKSKKTEKMLYEVSLLDHHFGSLAWEPESGENYNINIASDRYDAAVSELVSCIRDRDIAKIVYVVGHDLLHSEGATGETAHGTPQDLDSRWQKAYIRAFEAVTRGIESMAQLAPVDVVIVPGNHDKTTTFYLGHTLVQRYRNTDAINVDNNPRSRKKYKWGKVLLGFCHGGYKDDPAEKDLPLAMAQEWPSDWADTIWREWHLGDQHVHRSSRTPSGYQRTDQTYNGVIVRRLPSLCGTNAWHYGKAYAGFHGSEAYLWSDERGPVGSYMVPMMAIE